MATIKDQNSYSVGEGNFQKSGVPNCIGKARELN